MKSKLEVLKNKKILTILLVVMIFFVGALIYGKIAGASNDDVVVRKARIAYIKTGSEPFDSSDNYHTAEDENGIDQVVLNDYTPGNDSKVDNKIIRSFDKLTYGIDFSLESKNGYDDYISNKTVTVKVTLSSSEANYVACGPDLAPGQTTCEYTFADLETQVDSYVRNIELYVLGAPNKSPISPKIEFIADKDVVTLGNTGNQVNYKYEKGKYSTASNFDNGARNTMPTYVSSSLSRTQLQFKVYGQSKESSQKATYDNTIGRYLTYVVGLELKGTGEKGIKGMVMPTGDITFNSNFSQNGNISTVSIEDNWSRLYGTEKVGNINPVVLGLPYSSNAVNQTKYPGSIKLNKTSDTAYSSTISGYSLNYDPVATNADDSSINTAEDHYIGTYAVTIFSGRNADDLKNDITTNMAISDVQAKDLEGNNISVSNANNSIVNTYYEEIDYSLVGEFYDLANNKLSPEGNGKGSTSKGSDIVYKTTFNYKKTLSDQGLKEVIKVDPNAYRVVPRTDKQNIKITVVADDSKLSEKDFEVKYVTGDYVSSNYSISNNIAEGQEFSDEDISFINNFCSGINLSSLTQDQVMNLYGGPCIVANPSHEKEFEKITAAKTDGEKPTELPITKVIVQTKKGVTLPDTAVVIVEVSLRVRNVTDLTQTYQATAVATSSDYDSKLTYYSPIVLRDNGDNSITNPNNYKKTIYQGVIPVEVDNDSVWGDSLKIVNFTSRTEITVTNKNKDGSTKTQFKTSDDETINYNIKTKINDDNVAVGADDVWWINHLLVRAYIPKRNLIDPNKEYLLYEPDSKLLNPEIQEEELDGMLYTVLIYTLPYTKPNMKIPEINFKANLSPKIKGSGVDITVFSTVEAININGERDTSYFGLLTDNFTIYAAGVDNVILTQKVGEEGSVVEPDKSFSYMLGAYNNTSDDITDYTLVDVLPSSGDENKSKFSGSYTVKLELPNSLKGAKVYCSTQPYKSLTAEVSNSYNEFNECDILSDYVKATAIKITNLPINKNSYMENIKLSIKPKGNKYSEKYINSFVGGSPTKNQVKSNKTKVRVISRNISGRVFVDINENGIEDSGDKYIKNIPVTLYDLDGNNNMKEVISTTTNDKGEYKFKDLDRGRYKIRATYDSSLYDLTLRYATEDREHDSDAYKIKEGVVEISNRKFAGEIVEGIKLDATTEECADMNIGLINRKSFGFDISKYITKIDLNYNNTLTTYNYNNLNKVNISIKNSLHATAKVYYGIKIVNNSTKAGYVKLIDENIPDGLIFDGNDEYNKSWFYTDGTLRSTELENDLIEPGEARYLQIALDMPRREEAGTFINTVTLLKIMAYEPEQLAPDADKNSSIYEVGEAVDYAGLKWHVISTSNSEDGNQNVTLLADSGSVNNTMVHNSGTVYKWSTSEINKFLNNTYAYTNNSLNLPILRDTYVCDDASGVGRDGIGYGGTINSGQCLSNVVLPYKVRLLTEAEFYEVRDHHTDNEFLKGNYWLMNSVYEEIEHDDYGRVTNDKSNLAKFVNDTSFSVSTAPVNTSKEVRPVITVSNKDIIYEGVK